VFAGGADAEIFCPDVKVHGESGNSLRADRIMSAILFNVV
jgi:hypothetical protein